MGVRPGQRSTDTSLFTVVLRTDESSSPSGMKRHESFEKTLMTMVTAWLVMICVACAGPEPILRSNAKVLLQGREASKLDVEACQQKAEAAGLQPGTASRSGNMAAGAGLGLVAGAAVGATTGLIGGATGAAIGAAAGGGLGLIIGVVGGAYKPLEPDPPYADTVVKCLIEKGYDVTGWE